MRIFIYELTKLIKNIKHDHLSAYAGQAAYFIILCILPFLLFLLSIIQYLSVNSYDILLVLFSVIPKSYDKIVLFILDDIYIESEYAILPLSFLLTIWTAGKGTLVLSNGLNSVNKLVKHQNYFISRIKAMFYTLLLTLLAIVIVSIFTLNHDPLAFVIFFVIFTFIYSFLPSVHQPIRYQFPGALFTSFSWIIGVKFFSFYTETASMNSYMYGSLSYIIAFLIYLYILMYLFFIGAEINYIYMNLNQTKNNN